MKLKLIGTGLTGLSMLAASWGAQAADIPVFKARSVVAYYNWTGFYVGANAGYAWSTGSGTWTNGGFTGPFSGSGKGWLGGVQAGYNYQVGSIVYGLEADIQASGSSGSVTGTAGPIVLTATGKTPWFGTARGRLGYAFDRAMFYGTGGVVYGRSTLDGTLSTTGAFSSNASFWSWTLGGGLEYAFAGNWTAKLEYLYVFKPSDVPVAPGTTAVSGDGHTHIVRAGVNYKFAGPIFSRW